MIDDQMRKVGPYKLCVSQSFTAIYIILKTHNTHLLYSTCFIVSECGGGGYAKRQRACGSNGVCIVC